MHTTNYVLREINGSADSILEDAVKVQVRIRSNNRMKAQTAVYVTSLSDQESKLYSLLSMGCRTFLEIVEITGIGRTEAHYILRSLQGKKLVRAIPSNPVKFIALSKK